MQPKSGNRYDITIKDLFADETQELINYFGHLEARVTGDLKIEFPQVETRVSDLVMKAESQQGPLAIHLEFQSREVEQMLSIEESAGYQRILKRVWKRASTFMSCNRLSTIYLISTT